MSEEEIIEICNKLISDFNNFQEMRIKDRELNIYQWNCYDDIFREYKQAIQGLLDLYNKEKEKNNILENLLQGNLYEMYKYYKDLANSYQANNISKDKIREIKKY